MPVAQKKELKQNLSISRIEPGDISLPEIVHTGYSKEKDKPTFSLKKNKFVESIPKIQNTEKKK